MASPPKYITVDDHLVLVDYPRGVTDYYILPFQRAPEVQRLGLVLGKISAISAQENDVAVFMQFLGDDALEPAFQYLRWTRLCRRFEASPACGALLSNVKDKHVACIPADILSLHCCITYKDMSVPTLKRDRKEARTLRRVRLLLTLREIVRAADLEAEMRDLLPGIVLAAWPRLEWL